jgi:pyruvate/2-oxoglutarate dehydrogenase complex dihydrolipoamide acyltransferase (E2) component
MTHDRVMLLIDADNVSLDVIEQAVPWVHQHFGGPHVRRAYCTAESAVKHQAAFKRLGIRPMVNLAAGKNSTDIALAVDAIDLAISERPEVIVIASSDSDFAPLVSRLREKGCRVIGVGQQGKTGDETIGVYDDYEVLSHRKGTRAAQATAPAPAPAKAPAKKRAAKKAPAKKMLPAIPEKAQAIFDALPALAAGETVELRVAAERLREAQLLSRSGSSTKLFGQFPELFELRPEKQPNHVQRRSAR